ncbi:hypothetical protein SUGI_0810080 [Cryptomeria japonica]|nr:hypothetical protein SUGI_0810080 [Cryptomeria japonica]
MYPFGINGTNCGEPEFALSCKENGTYGDGKIPFLSTPTGEYQVLNLSTGFLIINTTHLKAKSCGVTETAKAFFELPQNPDGPFTISGTNVFASVGCYAGGNFSSTTPTSNNTPVGGSCSASCMQIYDPTYCNGFGCCQTTFVENWRRVNLSAVPYASPPAGQCIFSTVIDPSTFRLRDPSDRGKWGAGDYGLRIDWAIGDRNCSAANQTGPLACSKNADCQNVTGMPGYACSCKQGFAGDGYNGGTQCTDIDECASEELNNCIPPPWGRCTNLEGSYMCSCARGKGDGVKNCVEKKSILLPLLIGIFSSLIAAPLIAAIIFWGIKRYQKAIVRKKYFRQNGGLLLQDYLSSDRGRRKATIFTEAELEKATNNFSEDQKIGVGGFGYVFRGFLAEGRPVAVKKCKEIDQDQLNQFINEVIILSQIDHRNVVKLLGCCLETRVPLLIYEYVENGTLYDNLYAKDGRFLTWSKRLEIMVETAEALAYLHSSASIPIVHRDIKSANILLDASCSPKLADFGLSRLMQTENSHLTTAVKGTLGYLDPTYFATAQLTDKTDVYSFGVVMVEILTSLKPLSLDRAKEDRNLTTMFLARKRLGHVEDMLDRKVVKSAEPGDVESMLGVANLAEVCLKFDADCRPSMKEVVQELTWIRSKKKREEHPWLPRQNYAHEGLNLSSGNGSDREVEEAMPILVVSRERSTPPHERQKHVRFEETNTTITSSDMNTLSASPFDVESIHSLGGGR